MVQYLLFQVLFYIILLLLRSLQIVLKASLWQHIVSGLLLITFGVMVFVQAYLRGVHDLSQRFVAITSLLFAILFLVIDLLLPKLFK